MLKPASPETKNALNRLRSNTHFEQIKGWLASSRSELRDRLELTEDSDARGGSLAIKDFFEQDQAAARDAGLNP